MAAPFRAAVDGGARGNPGPAAWAVVVFDGGFATAIEARAGFLGHATNNVAEYSALLHALRLAQERGAQDVSVRADSELVVRQIHGTYKVRHPDLKPLHTEAMARIRSFAKFDIEHVRREANREADRFVNRVLDLVEKGEPLPSVISERFDAEAGES